MKNSVVGTFGLGLLLAGSLAVAQEETETETPRGHSTAAVESGSLWSDSGYQTFLSPDRKARAIGDLVTVKIVEASQASRSATTSLDRQSNVSAGVSAMFGVESSITKAAPNINPQALVGASTGNSFKGDGLTASSGSLTATITARVVKVLSNGNMLIQGQQEVKINNEVQILTIRGLVRPQDIQINNIILSTFVADARIEYSGNGVVSEKQKPGWAARAIDKVWPF